MDYSTMHARSQTTFEKRNIYLQTPSDIWTSEDHVLFLKFCPENRDKCYHAMANDTSCRPHELLSLKIKDIKFKISSTGRRDVVAAKTSRDKPS